MEELFANENYKVLISYDNTFSCPVAYLEFGDEDTTQLTVLDSECELEFAEMIIYKNMLNPKQLVMAGIALSEISIKSLTDFNFCGGNYVKFTLKNEYAEKLKELNSAHF